MVDKKIRMQAMKDISRALSRNGPDYDLHPLRTRKYTDVPTSTWYRWTAKVQNSGAPGRKAAKQVKKRAERRAKQPDPVQSATTAVAELLPAVIKPEDVAYTGLIPCIDRIQECLKDAQEIKEFCRTEAGKLRNPKLYLAASKHMLDSMKTAAYVSKQLMEAQRLEQFHGAILNRLKARDPVLVEQILCDLEQLNREWGAVE